MQVAQERCCGLDVHKKSVVACVITPEGQEIRTFGTMTRDLLELGDWLGARGVTHVAMESTGVFWKPVYNLLEGRFALLVVNAQHIKAIPGRKTDVKDAAWIADLLRHGLLRGSHIAERPERELQELVRYRTRLVQERAQVVQRIQKVLEGANIKLSAVAADVVGVSGRAMLEALVAGEEDPQALAALARGRLQAKRDALAEALRGGVGPAQRVLLGSQLRHLDFLEAEIEQLGAEVSRRLRPFEDALERLDTIPGMGRRAAERVVAEIGTDMRRFPSAARLASWAGLCPGTTRALASATAGAPGRATSGSRRPWSKRPGGRCVRARRTWPRSIAGSRRGAGPSARSSRWRTPSWSSSTMCSAMGPPTANWGAITSTNATARRPSAGRSSASSAWAIASPWRSPDPIFGGNSGRFSSPVAPRQRHGV